MKTKKRVLSTILSLSSLLLVGCNKTSPSSSSCSVTTSTPTSTVTPSVTKTVEELNKELFENYAITTESTKKDGTLMLSGFKDDIPEEYLNLETIIIPETIRGVTLTQIDNEVTGGTFGKLTKTKIIKIPANIKNIWYDSTTSYSSPFIHLPNLENIKLENNNETDGFYVKNNCLIYQPENNIVCGWKDVVIPEEITEIRNQAFYNNKSITSIKLHSRITKIDKADSYIHSLAFRGLDNLKSIDTNGNTRYEVKEGSNLLFDKDNNSIVVAYGNAFIPEEYSLTQIDLEYCTSLTNIIINSKITSINNYGLRFTKIEHLHLPKNVKTVYESTFAYMYNLKSITIDEGSSFTVEEGTNLLCDVNTAYAGWGDVVVPDNVTSIRNLSNNKSITSVKIGKGVANIADITFPSINSDRTYKDYVKISIDPENQKYHLNGNALIESTSGTMKLVSIQPNEQGEVEIPSEIKTIDREFGLLIYGAKIKSIKFNEGLETISTSVSSTFSSYSLITKLDFPTSLKIIKVDVNVNSSNNFFYNLYHLENITFGGRSENNYFKVESGCLIQKNGYDDGSDRILVCFNDVVIPDNITKLDGRVFSRTCSMKTLTLHKNIKEYDYINTFIGMNLNASDADSKNINYKGTIEEFKQPVGTSKSFYELFTSDGISSKAYKHYFLKEDGTYDGPYTSEQLKAL